MCRDVRHVHNTIMVNLGDLVPKLIKFEIFSLILQPSCLHTAQPNADARTHQMVVGRAEVVTFAEIVTFSE